MPDADRSADNLAGHSFLQIGQLAHAPAHLNLPIPQDRDAGRIVPAILQTLEAIQEDGDCILLPDISDDAAHPLILLSFLPFLSPHASVAPCVLPSTSQRWARWRQRAPAGGPPRII